MVALKPSSIATGCCGQFVVMAPAGLKKGFACAVSVMEHYCAKGRLCVRCAVMVPTGLKEGCVCAVQ